METIKESKFISAVIYVHNGENQIVAFLEKIIRILQKNFETFEVIVVNDASTDQTLSAIHKQGHLKEYNISIVNMSARQGLEISMNAGIDLSMGDFVYEFDDLIIDYDDDILLKSFHHIITGFDIISVSPARNNRITSTLFYAIFNKYSRSKYKLRTERFRILSRRAINRAYSISNSVPYRKALYANSGLNLDTILYNPVKRFAKTGGIEKVFRNRMAINAIIIYTNLAFKLSLYITFILFSFTLLAALYTLWVYLSNIKPIEGWTTLMLLISGSFSGLFFILAVIIKYLSLIVELVYSKKTYLVESAKRL